MEYERDLGTTDSLSVPVDADSVVVETRRSCKGEKDEEAESGEDGFSGDLTCATSLVVCAG